MLQVERERECVAIVSHQAVLRALYGYFIGCPLKASAHGLGWGVCGGGVRMRVACTGVVPTLAAGCGEAPRSDPYGPLQAYATSPLQPLLR